MGTHVERHEVRIPSGTDELAAWWYLPADAGDEALPAVVLAHGLGGVREMRLDAYARRFTAAGFACLVFDYRHFGASSGTPRQLLNITKQLADWRAAIGYVRAKTWVDPERVALWGSSFSGGHVLVLAADDPRIAAVVAQCPFTDGLASTRVTNPISSAKVGALAIADLVRTAAGRPPVLVAAAGPPRSAALMTAPDCLDGFDALGADAPTARNEIAARFGLQILRYRPGRQAARISCPVFFAVCDHDTVAPPAATLKYANRAPHGVVHRYPYGHFEIYLGAPFEHAVGDQTQFLREKV